MVSHPYLKPEQIKALPPETRIVPDPDFAHQDARMWVSPEELKRLVTNPGVVITPKPDLREMDVKAFLEGVPRSRRQAIGLAASTAKKSRSNRLSAKSSSTLSPTPHRPRPRPR